MRPPYQRTVIVLLTLGFAFMVEDASAQGLFKRLRERIGNAVEGRASGSSTESAPTLPARPIPPRDGSDAKESGSLPSAGYRAPAGSSAAPTAPRASGQFGGSILAPLQPAPSQGGTLGQASLGISGVPANPGYPGVRVTEIFPHSEAGTAGLRVGDFIFSLNLKPTPDVSSLAAEVTRRNPGDPVSLRVGREGRVFEIDVPLVASPIARVSADRPMLAPSPEPANQRSLLRPPTEDSSKRIGADVTDLPGKRGVLVESIDDEGPASIAGIAVGDQIIAIDGNLVSDAEALRRLIAISPGQSIEARVIREGRLLNVPVRLDATDTGSTSPPSRQPESDAPDEPANGGSDAGGFGSILGGLFGSQSLSNADETAPVAESSPKEPLDLELPPPVPDPKDDASKESLRLEIDTLKEKLKRLESELKK